MIKDLITDDLIQRAKTENEQALIKCLINSCMMLETYAKEIQSINRMFLIKDQLKINQDIILQTLEIS